MNVLFTFVINNQFPAQYLRRFGHSSRSLEVFTCHQRFSHALSYTLAHTWPVFESLPWLCALAAQDEKAKVLAVLALAPKPCPCALGHWSLTLTICLSDWKTSSYKSAVAYSPHSEKACCRLPFFTLSLMSVYLCSRVAGRGGGM